MVSESKQGKSPSDVEPPAARGQKLRYAVLRPVLDACTAFALFLVVSLALSSGPTSASPRLLLTPGSAFSQLAAPAVAIPGELQRDRQIFHAAAQSRRAEADAVYRQTDTVAAWMLLSFAFSLLAALNLALVRHLRQAYANPRKRN